MSIKLKILREQAESITEKDIKEDEGFVCFFVGEKGVSSLGRGQFNSNKILQLIHLFNKQAVKLFNALAEQAKKDKEKVSKGGA